MGGSIYFLDRMNAYHEIMHSSHIRHEWFKVGLAASIGELDRTYALHQILDV